MNVDDAMRSFGEWKGEGGEFSVLIAVGGGACEVAMGLSSSMEVVVGFER